MEIYNNHLNVKEGTNIDIERISKAQENGTLVCFTKIRYKIGLFNYFAFLVKILNEIEYLYFEVDLINQLDKIENKNFELYPFVKYGTYMDTVTTFIVEVTDYYIVTLSRDVAFSMTFVEVIDRSYEKYFEDLLQTYNISMVDKMIL